ncbi:HAMP domain-containing histidine kinase [Streptomyces cocklensis]|uniref:histidine kinase n=1 Tax=Actinacidiphila cocklensis TaxID=887465 RepID=A0A9W4E0Q5_9ACTN|nr:HAMP domain-containing sensor histidine kinase [Actinacidiphila cocklensis]MDD1063652.1 HAMP domain-containing histidine kinase [Actinacidiphila cocklensis]CAG6391145.1 Histidine kinase [Actinacidiphila cocklensis]
MRRLTWPRGTASAERPSGRRPRRPPLSALRPRTLRGRLALLALAVTAVWVTVLTVAANLVLGAQLRGQADDLLRTRSAAVAATIEARADGRIVVHEPSDDQALDVGVWIYQGRAAVERPAAPDALQRQADRLAGRSAVFADAAEPAANRLYALPVMAPAGDRQVGTVVATVALDPYRSTTRYVLLGSTGLALALLAAVYPVARSVAGRALQPVGAMSAQAAEWSEHGASRRFGTHERPRELAHLAGNLDGLLDRLAALVRHEQQLTAELSHELRTPLARITAEAEWLTARPRSRAEQAASHEAITASAAQMAQICEALLADARAGSADPGRCDPGEVATSLAQRRAEAAPDAVPVTVEGQAVTVDVPAALVERILTPLLDNADRYSSHAILVECVQAPGGAQVHVSDDGPGVPAALGPAVFEAGRRADSSDGHDGAGLGLALARRLARNAGGDITLGGTPGPLGGAHFVINLPGA